MFQAILLDYEPASGPGKVTEGLIFLSNPRGALACKVYKAILEGYRLLLSSEEVLAEALPLHPAILTVACLAPS